MASSSTTAEGAMESVRILHLSDTHGLHRLVEEDFPLPDADVLVVTGDFTDTGRPEEYEDFNAWLGLLHPRYPHIVVIFGNHEYMTMGETGETLQQLLDPQRAKDLLPNALVLEHEGVEILGVRIYGSPWCPWQAAARPGDGRPRGVVQRQLLEAWQASLLEGCRERQHRFDEIPEGVDVLLTHGSPFGIMDCCEMGSLQWGGSRALREAVIRARPRAHLFGHMHEQRGVWYHQPGMSFKGGIEYQLADGSGVHRTWQPPDENYPCELISCNAMRNHPGIDTSLGGPDGKRIAGPARLIVASRPVSVDGASVGPWRFTVPT
mmetsp:Transcript_18376/g.57824  ORF Transcript_18376/g.57824 Transcript_18376/m.57824 type:complete len:321 (-) Transcript_18376:3-965(-)|eukprot:CAMPEP_0204581904 /NCGR_PEP_ID=MMETSP0661-20131031/44916_1 /ASSEMBLY_ACC=CAM_ASM_000606 /TAXON_ID=109239 /ORGANISM="Alexandrium margalefi, Strain AMGDE01CS-322" /LENGTH=320 /DNA_ID=CAMNT_0051591135 /DNA_START=44 /DNA_END=1002 /DNA_ORIENTATION=+